MQIRCQNCHKPFAMGKEAVHTALDEIQADELSYYTIHCPHCSKANRVSKEMLQRSAPDWRGNHAESGEVRN
jgi:hypothetical protein